MRKRGSSPLRAAGVEAAKQAIVSRKTMDGTRVVIGGLRGTGRNALP
jgi:hypothetical protein